VPALRKPLPHPAEFSPALTFADFPQKSCPMKRKSAKKSASGSPGLLIRPGASAPLSPTQLEFNRLMKSLETARTRHLREQARLDETLTISIRELMPLVESLNRVNLELVMKGHQALQTLKLSAKRRHWFGDLLSGKAEDLLSDPVGLAVEELAPLEAILKELGPSADTQWRDDEEDEEFDFLRAMIEQTARQAGVELDLSDLDPKGDPKEFDRIVRERLGAAAELFEGGAEAAEARKPRRKPTKAQAARERQRLALEEARKRDLKSLFKQLAKAFHPDLEPDPLLRQHKQSWMQRLNTAYETGDLREMLQLEMEWLGEEASNLATAGDEKLKVYCMVLKEQISDLKRQTHELRRQPQYGPLRRFIDPFFGTLASPASLRRELQWEVVRHREMLQILAANNAASRRMIYEWADAHALHSSCPF
jgi:hypothetical protein